MEKLNLALVSSPKPLMLGHVPARDVFRRKHFSFGRVLIAPHRCRFRVSALSSSHHNPKSGIQFLNFFLLFCFYSHGYTWLTISKGLRECLDKRGSPLFWIGVGVGLSALFSVVASRLKKYAMQQAFKTMMGQMNSQNNQFGNAAFSPGSPFPFPMPTAAGPTAPASSATTQSRAPSASSASQSTITVDLPAAKVEAAPTTNVKDEVELKNEPKKIAFVDVSPEETVRESPFESFKDDESSSVKEAWVPDEVSQNGAPSNLGFGDFPGSQSTRMLQNPQYRQQLEEMLNNMGGSTEWDNRMMDTLKNFDLNSPEVKQQFDQIGLSPEEVISKIMANPEVAMAFQNPRVQAAIMDCSQNPMNITKYQNDKEVMDVFNKISELFPGVGSQLQLRIVTVFPGLK
ncbi:hypothetical protein JHK85_032528 [Glycine max]|nr:hypothetical protein JHK85_032528 [Glycine max]